MKLIDADSPLQEPPVTETADVDTGDLSLDSVTVLRRLQAALGRMLAFAPGGITKSRDLQKLLGIDVKLSWQIFRFIGPGDVLSLSTHIPTAKSFRRLCDSAKAHGADALAVEEVLKAYGVYESLVRRHADDRTSFESMLSALEGNQSDPQADLNHRRAIFTGHRHYWGTQMQTYIVSQFVHPTDKPNRYDFAHLRSRFGLRRLRANADIFVDTYKLIPPGGGDDNSTREHFDEQAVMTYGAAVLPEFSTHPLPELHTSRMASGVTRTQLVGDAIGRTSSVDMTFGHISRNVPTEYLPNGDRVFGMGVRITIPMMSVIVNAFLHEDVAEQINASLAVYGHAADRDQVQMRQDSITLPFREGISYLGKGVATARNREVLQYTNLLEYVCRHMKWNPDEFNVYSLRLDYPLLDTMLDLQLTAPGETQPIANTQMFGDFI
ncbi:MAG: hypothetical protein QM754_05265 [Tepidisphaeraceae bacterium]